MRGDEYGPAPAGKKPGFNPAGCAAGIILVVAGAVPFLFYQAWVASYLWLWFVAPLGFPELSVWQMLGVILFLSSVRSFSRGTRRDDRPVDPNLVVLVIVMPLILLGIGSMIHLYLTP